LSYTALNIRLNSTIDFVTTQCVYIRKAAIRLKSFSYYRALSSNCSITSLLVWGDSLVIKSDVLLVSKLVSGTSCLGIFGPSLVVD
jgi:hypothetical protein